MIKPQHDRSKLKTCYRTKPALSCIALFLLMGLAKNQEIVLVDGFDPSLFEDVLLQVKTAGLIPQSYRMKEVAVKG